MKRFVSFIILISLIMSMLVPFSFAENDNNENTITVGGYSLNVNADYSSECEDLWDMFFHSMMQDTSGEYLNLLFTSIPKSKVYSSFSNNLCSSVNSPDGFHHADSISIDPEDSSRGLCVCKYCGDIFGVDKNNIKNACEKHISDLGLQNMTKNADGSLDWQLTWDDFFSSSESYFGFYIRKDGSSLNYSPYVRNNSSFPVSYSNNFGSVTYLYLDKYSCSSILDSNSTYYIDSFKFGFKFTPTIIGTYYSPSTVVAKDQDGNSFSHSQTSNITVTALTERNLTFATGRPYGITVYDGGMFFVLPKIHIIPGSPIEQEIPQTVSIGDTTINVTSYDFSNMTYYGTDSVNNYNYSVTFYDNSVSVSHIENNETIINNYYYYMPSSGSGSSSGSGGSVNVDLSTVEQLLQEIYDLIEDCGLDSHDDPYLQSIYSVLNSYAFGSGSGSLEGDFSDVLNILTQIRAQLSILSSFSASNKAAFFTAYNTYLQTSLTMLDSLPAYQTDIQLMTNFLLANRNSYEANISSSIGTFERMYYELMSIGVYDLEAAERLTAIANMLISQGTDVSVIAALLDDLKDNSDNLVESADFVLEYLEDVVIHNAYEEDKLDDIYDAINDLASSMVASGIASTAASLLDSFLDSSSDLIPDIDIPSIGNGVSDLARNLSQPFSFKSLANNLFSWIGSVLSFIWDFFVPTAGVSLLVDSFNESTDFWELEGSYKYKPYRIATFISHNSYENSSAAVQALFDCAEQYLGFPYVWGGSSPSTSFDCSGFVYYVLNESGVYECSRKTAQGFYNICTPVSADQAQPGDLIFFSGTYQTSDTVTHIGIYAGDGRMIHCGDPIQYTSINTDYWQQHFYSFGRLDYNDVSEVTQ